MHQRVCRPRSEGSLTEILYGANKFLYQPPSGASCNNLAEGVAVSPNFSEIPAQAPDDDSSSNQRPSNSELRGVERWAMDFHCLPFTQILSAPEPPVNQTARWQGQNQIDPTFLEPTSAVTPTRLQLAIRLNF